MVVPQPGIRFGSAVFRGARPQLLVSCLSSRAVLQKRAGAVHHVEPGLLRRAGPAAQAWPPPNSRGGRGFAARAAQEAEARKRGGEFSGRQPLHPPLATNGSNRVHDHAAQRSHGIALLIDGDNTGASHLASILDALQQFGHVIAGRVYIRDRSRIAKWATKSQEVGISAISLEGESSGVANASKELVDKQIFWDAAMFAFNPVLALSLVGKSEACISAIAIVSQDFDFFHIARQLHYARQICDQIPYLLLVQYAPRLAVPNQRRDALQKHGATFVPYDLRGKTRQSSGKAICMQHGSSFLCARPDVEQVSLSSEQIGSAAATLASCGYLERGETFIHMRAVACFFFVNELEPLVICPCGDALRQLVKALDSQPDKAWKPDARDLVYIHPVGNTSGTKERSTANKNMTESGVLPFLTQSSEELVLDVLTRLGYSYSHGLETMVGHFWERNLEFLKKAGVPVSDLQGANCFKRERILFKAFSSRASRGHWRVP